jgi:hypothetical protein
MDIENISVAELEARRTALLRQLRRAGPLIDGSLAVVHRRCGTPACGCHQDDSRRHRQVMLCGKVGGRSHSTHIPRDLEEQVRRWNEEHKRVKAVLKDICTLGEQIIRRHVAERRTLARASRPLHLLPGAPPSGGPAR